MHPIVAQMMASDTMSQWLGIEVLESGPGTCRCSLKVREDMVNGFGIAHGAISYALADSTLAFAVNAKGRHAVSVTSTIQHLAPVMLGDTLTSEAIMRSEGGRVVHVDVAVHNQREERVAWLTATGFKIHELDVTRQPYYDLRSLKACAEGLKARMPTKIDALHREMQFLASSDSLHFSSGQPQIQAFLSSA